jgi:hypothetical protein
VNDLIARLRDRSFLAFTGDKDDELGALLREAADALEQAESKIVGLELLVEQREACAEYVKYAEAARRADAAEAKLERAEKALRLLLDQPAVRALDRDAFGVPSNIGPYQLACEALAALDGQDGTT